MFRLKKNLYEGLRRSKIPSARASVLLLLLLHLLHECCECASCVRPTQLVVQTWEMRHGKVGRDTTRQLPNSNTTNVCSHELFYYFNYLPPPRALPTRTCHGFPFPAARCLRLVPRVPPEQMKALHVSELRSTTVTTDRAQ